MAYWLMKSEPDEFSIQDLYRSPGQRACWDGVRNYQARNMLRDQMRLGDEVLFYHSSCTPPGVAGIARVVREGYPDDTAWNPDSPYFDPKSSPDNPRWYRVDVEWVRTFPRLITLDQLRAQPALADMLLLRKGNRLSVMPVSELEWRVILGMADLGMAE